MPRQPYRGYDVLARWHGVSFDAVTRRVLQGRMHSLPPRRFFSEHEWRLVDALAARIVPQPERADPVPVTPWIDAQLYEGLQEGFRYAGMPKTADAWRRGLAAIDAQARHLHDCGFAGLDAQAADALLESIERGQANLQFWPGLDPQRFFIHVLVKTIAGIYYAHPAAWNEIGFGGPASPRGYVRLGFDQRDPWEAKEER